MVTRKPGNNAAGAPITPLRTTGSFHVQDAHHQLIPSASDSETPDSAWAAEASDGLGISASQGPPSLIQPALKPPQAESTLPLSLQAGAGRENTSIRSSMERPRSNEHVPESLRPGPPSYTPRSSQEIERPALLSTNPFRRQHSGQSSLQGGESSAAAWSGVSGTPATPSSPPPPIPASAGMHHLDLLFGMNFWLVLFAIAIF